MRRRWQREPDRASAMECEAACTVMGELVLWGRTTAAHLCSELGPSTGPPSGQAVSPTPAAVSREALSAVAGGRVAVGPADRRPPSCVTCACPSRLTAGGSEVMRRLLREDDGGGCSVGCGYGERCSSTCSSWCKPLHRCINKVVLIKAAGRCFFPSSLFTFHCLLVKFLLPAWPR